MTENTPATKNPIDTLAEIKTQITEERDLCNQLIGRIQFAHGVSKLLTVSALKDLQTIKERKLYKGLCISDAAGKSLTVSTFNDFCAQLGMSGQHINEQLLNLRELGEEAIESMNRIGLGYRDLRKLRKLDESDQQIVIGELEASVGDKEAVVSLIDDLARKHLNEKQSLEHQLAEQKKDTDATEQLLVAKNEKIDQLSKQLSVQSAQSVDEHAEWVKKELTTYATGADINITKIRNILDAVFENDKSSRFAKWYCAGVVRGLEAQLADICDHFSLDYQELPPQTHEGWDVSDVPVWAQDYQRMADEHIKRKRAEAKAISEGTAN